jgi:hypothetical protein
MIETGSDFTGIYSFADSRSADRNISEILIIPNCFQRPASGELNSLCLL